MAEAWFCQLEGEQVGPIDSAQLQGLAKRGRVTPETLVRTAQGKNWVPAGKVSGLKFAPVESAVGASATPAPVAPTAAPSAPPAAATPPAAAANASANASATPAKNPSTATMRAQGALKKAKLLEPGKSPAQVGRAAAPAPASEPVPPPPAPPPGPYDYAAQPPYPYGAPPAPYGAYPAPPPAGGPAPAYYGEAPGAGYPVAPSPVPAGIPSGIPVGVAVGSGAPPAPVAPGVGEPWINVNSAPNAAPTAAKAKGDGKAPLDRKAAARRKLYWMVGGVAGALLAVGGIAAAVALSGGSKQDGVPVAKKSLEEEISEAGAEDAAKESDATSDPAARDIAGEGGAAGENQSISTKSDKDKSKASRKSATQGDVAAALKSVSKWVDTSRLAAVTSASMKLQVTGTWFEASGTSGGEGEGTSDSAGQRLFVELRLTNVQAEAPLNYVPWNGDGSGGGKTLAMLATEDGRACPFVSLAKAADPARQKAPLRLKPGQSVTDVLVFDVSGNDSEMLQLLLPTAAFGQAGRHLGIKIARDSIAAARPVELAGDAPPTRAVNANKGADPVGDPTKIIADPPAAPATPAAAAKPAPAMREESIDDLKKSIVDESKQKQKEKDQEVSKMREETKKKPD